MKVKATETSAGNPEYERLFIDEIYQGAIKDFLGDAIEIAQLESTRISVSIYKPYIASLDEFEGRFSLSRDKNRFTHWMEGYTTEAQDFIAKNIEVQSRPGVRERAKLGFVSVTKQENNPKALNLFLRPVNHLVSTAFNKKLGADRAFLEPSSKIHNLWMNCYRHAVEDYPRKITYSFPNQLYVEAAILTNDGYVTVTQKHSKTSVYSLRNEGRFLRTCGIEAGLDWKEVISPIDASGTAELDVTEGFFKGVKREFPMKDWDDRKTDIDLKITSLAIENLHLNTAIIGICRIPYSSSELIKELKGRRCGGLDHTNLDFIPVSKCAEYVEKFKNSTEWHGTAMIRLDKIAKFL